MHPLVKDTPSSHMLAHTTHKNQIYPKDEKIEIKSQHRPQRILDPKRRLRLRRHLIDRHPLRDLDERQPVREVDVEDAEVGDDARHARSPRQGELALFPDLGAARLVDVFHRDDDFGRVRVGDEVHGAAEAFDLAGEHPCGGAKEEEDGC